MTTTRLDQRHAALIRANEIRFARVELRRSWKAGGRDMALREFGAAVLDPPPWLETVRLETILSWLPGVGSSTVRRFTTATGIPGHTRLGSLTLRQRDAVLDWAEIRRGSPPDRRLTSATSAGGGA